MLGLSGQVPQPIPNMVETVNNNLSSNSSFVVPSPVDVPSVSPKTPPTSPAYVPSPVNTLPPLPSLNYDDNQQSNISSLGDLEDAKKLYEEEKKEEVDTSVYPENTGGGSSNNNESKIGETIKVIKKS